jgi:hypothetical protein
VRKEFLAHGEDSFWAFFSEQREQLPCREPQQQQPGQQQHRVPLCPQFSPMRTASQRAERRVSREALCKARSSPRTPKRTASAKQGSDCFSREALWIAVPRIAFPA